MPSKISDEFMSKIRDARDGNTSLSVIIILDVGLPPKKKGRQTPEERQQIVAEVKQRAEEKMPSVKQVIEMYGGTVSSKEPDAIGSIVATCPPAGVLALSNLSQVKTILENQKVHGISRKRKRKPQTESTRSPSDEEIIYEILGIRRDQD